MSEPLSSTMASYTTPWGTTEVPATAASILSEANLKRRLAEVMEQAEVENDREQDLRRM